MFERRKYERIEFQKELIIMSDSPEHGKPIEFYAQTLNISRGGMLLYTIAEFKEKKKCIVRFKSNRFERVEKHARILRMVQGDRPDHLKEVEKMYALEFDRVLPDEEFQQLLARPGQAALQSSSASNPT